MTGKKSASKDQEARQADDLARLLTSTAGAEKERLARIVDLLPCYILILDQNYRPVFYNKAFVDYFGEPADMPCYAVMHGKEEPCSHCPPFDAGQGTDSSVKEWVHAKNRYAFRIYSYPFEENGKACILQVGFNITASVRVQQALELSEQSYRAITDNLSIGVALIDTKMQVKAGNIRLSQWFAEKFRMDRKVCEILHCQDFVAKSLEFGPDYFCPDCPFQASMSDGASHEKELSVIFEDGKEHMVRLVTCPVKPAKSSPDGSVRALIMMLEDITIRLRVNQQLQRARKLEAMSTLAGGIAHEINQPLSALHLYASGLQILLEKQGTLPPEVTQERLGLIMREAEKIRSIISHMRALVMREGRVPVSAVSIPAAIESALSIMKTQFASRGILIVVETASDLPPVRSNMVQLEQVLVNLLANAMHAMANGSDPARGKKTILLKAYTRQSDRDNLNRIRLEVADSGPGLPKGSEKIFDPFYTTKERHEGMGLGLSIVYGLVSLWGADISAATHHPKLGGAVFYVDFHQAEEGDIPTDEGSSAIEGVAL